MGRELEIVGKFQGELFVFQNVDSRVIIGSIIPNEESAKRAEEAGAGTWSIAIKGAANDGELQYNCTYRFFGRWRNYFNRRRQQDERQFHFTSFVEHVPHDREGIANYLTAAGRGRGIGPVKARKLVDEFGIDDVLRVCREEPEVVRDAVRINSEQAESFSRQLKSQAATESATLEINQLFKGRGFAQTLGKRVISKYGNQAVEIIESDPYELMRFRGVGFKLADRFYISLGKDAKSIRRQSLCLWHQLASDSDGHTWHRFKPQATRLSASIGDGADPIAAIRQGVEIGKENPHAIGAIAGLRTNGPDGAIAEDGDTVWIAEARNAEAERYIAAAVVKAMHEARTLKATRFEQVETIREIVLDRAICARCDRQLTADRVHLLNGQPYGPTCIEYVDHFGQATERDLHEWLAENPEVRRYIDEQPAGVIRLPEVSLWPDVNDLVIPGENGENLITDHQREQAGLAMSGRVGILAGSPGTGKTTLVASIIRALHRSGRVGLGDIIIGAPTGKAAVRITESLTAQGLRVHARTWHSLLGVGESDAETGHWEFQHNETNPWQCKVIIGDEWSMPDVQIAAAIMKARPAGAHMLLVGDVNQLPPVGPGAPFRDLIGAKLPYGELKEIKRNSGGIVESCAAIRDQRPWIHDLDETSNLVISNSRTPEKQIEYIIDGIHREASENGVDPVWDCQVICAVNKGSELSRAKLNEQLQSVLNPGTARKGTIFRERDKVVCLKNTWARVEEPDETDIGDECSVNDRGEVYIANGELGRVHAIDEKSMIVDLENPDRRVRVYFGKSRENDDESSDDESPTSRCSWDLGYALSCHKFQGSEQKVVFVVLDTYGGARMVCDRAWIYTAISRASERCYLVGVPQTIEGFCRHQKIQSRQTMLQNFVAIEQFEREVVSL